MIINCIIVDDEPLSRAGLKEYVSDIAFLHLSGEFDNALDASPIIATGNIQLIFLDIQMPKITGLDFFKTLHHPPAVIFTTAFPEYAVQGFDLEAMDYLLKPISFERFLKAATKAREFFELKQKNGPGTGIAEEVPPYFFIKTDSQLVKIMIGEILFIEALQNYVAIHTPSKKYISYLTFKAVEDYLPPGKFIKVHKSYIAAAEKIDSIDGSDIRIGNHHIPISRNLKEEVLQKLLEGKYLKR